MLVETDYSELVRLFKLTDLLIFKEKVDIHKTVVPGTITQLHRAIKEVILMISDMSTINKTLNELQVCSFHST